MNYSIEPIGYIHNNYIEKFGIPRQSGIIKDSISTIIFEKKYQDDNSLRGLEEYSHIWLLWIFNDKNTDKEWSPTVRPPRLGGNKRMGVFATRSPYHPNGIGLSCVRIVSFEKTADNGTVINVEGADLLCGTPIIDIKPYLSFTDCREDAICGFAENTKDYKLNVRFDTDISSIKEEVINEITQLLMQDPRPSYQDDSDRVYSMRFAEFDIKFKVVGNNLNVIRIETRTDVKDE